MEWHHKRGWKNGMKAREEENKRRKKIKDQLKMKAEERGKLR